MWGDVIRVRCKLSREAAGKRGPRRRDSTVIRRGRASKGLSATSPRHKFKRSRLDVQTYRNVLMQSDIARNSQYYDELGIANLI